MIRCALSVFIAIGSCLQVINYLFGEAEKSCYICGCVKLRILVNLFNYQTYPYTI